jgi:hypothetical protein
VRKKRYVIGVLGGAEAGINAKSFAGGTNWQSFAGPVLRGVQAESQDGQQAKWPSSQ